VLGLGRHGGLVRGAKLEGTRGIKGATSLDRVIPETLSFATAVAPAISKIGRGLVRPGAGASGGGPGPGGARPLLVAARLVIARLVRFAVIGKPCRRWWVCETRGEKRRKEKKIVGEKNRSLNLVLVDPDRSPSGGLPENFQQRAHQDRV